MGDFDNESELTMPTDAELGIEAPGGPADGGMDQGGGAGEEFAPEPQQRRDVRVPLPEVQQTRDRLKAAEAEITRLRKVEEEKIRYEERLNFHRGQQEAAQRARQAEAERLRLEAEKKAADNDPMPDKDIDGIEALNEWRYRQLEKKLQAQAQQGEEQAQQAREAQGRDLRMRVISSVAQEYTAFENSFTTKEQTRDYPDAFNHVVAVYVNRFERRGIPDDRELGEGRSRMLTALEAERAKLIRDCLELNEQTGAYRWVRDPAQLIYEEAIDLGYLPAAARISAAPQREQAAAAQAQRVPSERARMLAGSTAAAARNGGGRAGGAVEPRHKVTIEDINRMTDDQYLRFKEEFPDEEKEAMGYLA